MEKESVFLISPVRNWDKMPEEEKGKITAYVRTLEGEGHNVFWPRRDNPHQETDKIGIEIVRKNISEMKGADEIHVWWKNDSAGSAGDLETAMALEKPIKLANPEDIERTPGKSFTNVLLFVTGRLR